MRISHKDLSRPQKEWVEYVKKKFRREVPELQDDEIYLFTSYSTRDPIKKILTCSFKKQTIGGVWMGDLQVREDKDSDEAGEL